MHIPDGMLSVPVLAATSAVAAGGAALALRSAKRNLDEKEVPLLGVLAAFTFAAQMLNFPIAPGASGHYLGAAVAVVLLGPWKGGLVMGIVLAIQCLFYTDGGFTAFGANLFNMAVVGGGIAYGVYRLGRACRLATPIAASVAAWCSIMAAAAAFAAEIALSGRAPIRVFLPAILGWHALIGAGEAIITGAVMSLLVGVRPDLIRSRASGMQTLPEF